MNKKINKRVKVKKGTAGQRKKRSIKIEVKKTKAIKKVLRKSRK